MRIAPTFCLIVFLFSVCCVAEAADFELPADADFSPMSWVDAFAALHRKMSVEYAFSTWKKVDWTTLKRKYGDVVAEAQKGNDRSRYAAALKAYVLSLPDGHVSIRGGDYRKAMSAALKGSYGITLALVDGGRVVVGYVDAASAAARGGIEAGAEILTWNNETIKDRLRRMEVDALVESGIATDVQMALRRCQRLTRDVVGATARISYRNPLDGRERNIELTAYDDRLSLLNGVNFIFPADFESPTVEYRLLSGNYGYLRIKAIIDLDAVRSGTDDPHMLFGTVYDKFHEAMDYFVKRNVQGVIVDLRGNAGGSDQLASRLAGFFYRDKAFYERQMYFNALTNRFELRTFVDYSDEIVDALYIEPQSPYVDRPVIAIVDPGTISSGEGLAMGIQNAEKGHVVGFYGTNGSFGMTGGEVDMPGGIHISYPYGRSLNEEGAIQLDSRNGEGGVSPDFIVPVTSENAVRLARGEDVLLEYAERKLQELSAKR